MEKTLSAIAATLTDTSKSWDLRVSAVSVIVLAKAHLLLSWICAPEVYSGDEIRMFPLRSVTDQEIIDHTHYAMLLKGLETAISESVRADVMIVYVIEFHPLL